MLRRRKGSGTPVGQAPGQDFRRRCFPQRRRRILPLVLAGVAALLLVGVAVTVPLVLGDDETEATGPVNLDDVREYDDLEVAHTTDDVDYPQSPPVGGPHAPVWLDCGVYDEPVRDPSERGTRQWASSDRLM